MEYKTKIGTAVAIGSLMLATLMPGAAAAATNITISGNGADSNNTANVTNSSNTTVNQTNTQNVSLNISVSAKTGKNTANNNTGGDVEINTGKADATSTINITGGSNTANISCGCLATNDTIDIMDNGAESDNKSIVKNKKKAKYDQGGNQYVTGTVKVKAKTGKNKAKNNTTGNVTITTDDATSTSNVTVNQPPNELIVTP